MATGTGNLPNPSMAFTPFDILLAEELNDLVENIEALATGSGIGDGAIGTSDLANSAVTSQKVDFTTFTHIEAKGIITTGTIAGNGSQSINVTIPTQPNTSYNVLISTGVTAGSFWTFLVPRVSAKTTSQFTAQIWNNSSSSAGATSFEYIVVR